MIRRFSLIAFAMIASTSVPSALAACSPPDENTVLYSLISPIPAKEPPHGAIQLKVDTSEGLSPHEGRATLDVIEVINGEFESDEIGLNITNANGCDISLYMVRSNESFVTVLPLMYADGEAITDHDGKAEYGGLSYRDSSELLYGEHPPKFASYGERTEFNFLDFGRLDCLMQNGESDAAWRQCVEPGEYVTLDCIYSSKGAFACEQNDVFGQRPLDLRRGHSYWSDWRSVGFATLSLLVVLLLFGSIFLRIRRQFDD